jgi:hypothetical protein
MSKNGSSNGQSSPRKADMDVNQLEHANEEQM